MEKNPIKQRLTAILAADAFGYSTRMGEDEERALRTLQGHRRLIDGLIADHGGRIVGTAGDSVLAEFGSSVAAVRCAVEIQESLATRNDSLPAPERMQFRIGINLGDVIVDGADILGDGVNVASRLEGIADPGGICIASSVFDQISGKLNLGFEDIGERSLKNIGRPVRAYRLHRAGAPQPRGGTSNRNAVAVVAAAVVVAIAAGVFYMIGKSDRGSASPPAEVASTAATAPLQETAQPAAPQPPAVPPPVPDAPSPQEQRALPVESPARAPAPPATKPVELSARASAPPIAAAPEPSSPAAYTMGSAQGRCERPDGSLGPMMRGPVQIVDGEVLIAVGTQGQPGSVTLRGRPDADGTLVLSGFIMPGVGRGRGNKIAARYEGRLNNGRGMLTGTQGALRCTLGLMLK